VTDLLRGSAARSREGSLTAPLLDLEQTLTCGQVFHWQRAGAGWVGAMGDESCFLEQRESVLAFRGVSERDVRRYLGLDHPLEEIQETFPSDEAMVEAREFCRGLRIVRQPAWECLATFITSALKQVPHIAQISHTLRERYGPRLPSVNDTPVYAYPAAERIAELSEADLRECRLGFRAKNLLGAARMIAAEEVDLALIATLPDDEARQALCQLPGVGEKVANCVLLFGYGRLRAFPIDVWIERVLREIYFRRKRKVTSRRLREFSASYFGPYGGYAQQYLFHHARMTRKKGGAAKE
jgi:N-glycosylase/DNA lyase